ncbi:ADP-forming succinate--CoA ligase subunit beta [Sodalis endosymbiont of Henestaris halophilus]|uniref:ADP-forming succinate--CoA ligase subunit beta n=1 Tax=Sodalis endosymbiont of Henestaris halophilus TaxID=1929246 RepID=UPI000BC003EC|nr:ADP-forming succinate--CoA ligase subunit beta [Sodalis endosymbiont of Henestaris halophilus]SNC59110.1 Succinyl-CoA ligase [ADP-forming] subunit beta [Sodalis endosymbiont of Henestaris halophilus]
MNLHEYQAKQLFARYGLPVPTGYVCNTPREAEESASKIGDGPWVVKCQVHAGGRGKVGGVKVVKSKKEVSVFAAQWLGNRLVTYQTDALGKPVNQILVEATTDIFKELYLGAVVDRCMRRVVFMASAEGGVDIEKIVEVTPHLIHKVILDPLIGPQPYQGRELAFNLSLIGKQVIQFSEIFMRLATLFLKYDLALVEINPLVITSSGDLLCLDGKLTVDGNALFRQPELREMWDRRQEDEREAYATQLGLNYVALDGNIGCMVNGAGLAMGTMDIVKLHGGEPANFLDVGGSATKERVTQAFKIILSDKKVKAILVNIFGGIVRCDLIADGIIDAVSEVGVSVPVVVRLEGNNAELGANKLADSWLNIISTTSLINAVKKVIDVVADT